MMVLPWQKRCRLEDLVHFYDTIANTVTALQVGNLDGEQVRVKVLAANNVRELCYRIRTVKRLQKRNINDEEQIHEFRS